MWFGHFLVALLIATFDWNLFTIFFVLAFTFLPNIDVIFVWLNLRKEEFHCGITHTLLFAIVAALIILPFSSKYAVLAFISILAHILVDLPTDFGMMLFYPFSKKRITLNLWKETGFWGFKAIKGYYKQKWALVLEIIVLIILIIRLILIYS